MATLVLSGVHSSGPGLNFQLYAEQTGGSGNSRTIKLTLNLKVDGSTSASWFGYAMDHRFNVNGGWSGWTQTKGTESWNATQGYRSWTYTVTTDVGTSAEKDITVGFQTDAHHSSNSWDTTRTGTFRVGKTNTAPTWPTGQNYLRIRPAKGSSTEFTGYYPENTTYLFLEWGAASDSEGGTLEYSLNQSVDGGGWSRIDYGTDREHGHTISSGNEGQRLQFYVDVKDNGGLWSSQVHSSVITKNTLSGGTVSSVTSINYDSTSFEVTVGAGRNTDGSEVKYRVYSDNITIYNQNDQTGLKHTVQIYKTGTVPTTPYVKFDDIKNYLKNSSYNGRIHIGVKTTNNYGSVKWAGGSVGVDLRTNPVAASGHEISKSTAESTMYVKPTFSPNYYFLPDGNKVARVKWTLGSDKLGGSITQELYVAYGSGSWQKIADLSGSTTYYNHTIATQTSRQQFKYLIRTKTSYGNYSDAQTTAENLEYYNSPKLSVGTISRTAWTAEVKLTVKSDSSIPNIGTTGWWECRNTGEMVALVENPNGYLNSTQNEQLISIDPLFGEYQHVLLVNYNDNTGFSTDKRQEVSIPANLPVFFVNKYGAGVNGYKANIDTAFNIKGSVFPNTTITGTIGYNETPFGLYMMKNETVADGFPVPYFTAVGVTYTENRQFQIGANNAATTLAFRSGHVNNTGGDGTGWSPWKKIYHEGYKPTPADIGAATSGHTHNYIPKDGDTISFNNDRGLSWRSNGDGADITFHADNPSSNSYLRYSVTDDMDEYHAFGGTHWNNGWSEWLRIGNGETTIRGHARVEGAVKLGVASSGADCNGLANDHYHNTRNNASNRPRDYCVIRSFGWADNTNTRMQLGWYYGKGNEFYMRSQFDQDSSWDEWQRIPGVKGDGGLEGGIRYLDFHLSKSSSSDFDYRFLVTDSGYGGQLQCSGKLVPEISGGAGRDLGISNLRWNTIYAVNGTINTSDSRWKKNIRYLDATTYSRSGELNTPFKDFLTRDFRVAMYTMIGSAESDEEISLMEKNIVNEQLGFIAQDIINTDVGKTFVYDDGENPLMYSTNGYITMVAKALQEEILYRDMEINNLKKEIESIKEALGL